MSGLVDKKKLLEWLGKERSCRICKHFIRVKEEGDFKTIRRRGFCVLGQLEGDFSLLLDASRSGSCPAFILDTYNCETTLKERELSKKWSDFRWKVQDKRTKEHKVVAKLAKELLDCFKLEEALMKGIDGLIAHGKVMKIAYEYFIKANKKDLDWLRQRKAIDGTRYIRLMGAISKALTDLVEKGEFDAKKRA